MRAGEEEQAVVVRWSRKIVEKSNQVTNQLTNMKQAAVAATANIMGCGNRTVVE